ncbi:MAG: tetratricopeptide repeat protein [Terriglobales bacterium]|jgi:tol-pal system protein YbgF
MKSNRIPLVHALFLALFLTICIVPAYGASKEIIELQTQVTQLQQQMTAMKQSFDERMGVMKNLLEQNTDVANKVATAINDLQASIGKQQQDRAGQLDQISGQIQALNDTMDELKVRLAKLSKQFEDMQAAQQSLAAQQAAAEAQQQAMKSAPPPDVLYNNALRDYNGGKNDLAVQEFNDYVKFYPNTDLAGNAYFYLAEIQFKAGDYQKAVASYDLVLQDFPGGNKAAAAQLKKGFALLELGKVDEGTQELKHVLQRYPRTNEATQARERLRKLGPATPKHRQ